MTINREKFVEGLKKPQLLSSTKTPNRPFLKSKLFLVYLHCLAEHNKMRVLLRDNSFKSLYILKTAFPKLYIFSLLIQVDIGGLDYSTFQSPVAEKMFYEGKSSKHLL